MQLHYKQAMAISLPVAAPETLGLKFYYSLYYKYIFPNMIHLRGKKKKQLDFAPLKEFKAWAEA